jgi:CxxC-x17-CxxC domain-containing protein
MGNFNRDRGPRDGNRRMFGGESRGRGGYGRDGAGDRQMFSTVCSSCGKNCEVPFKPTGEKPVYCKDCFEKMGGRSERKSLDRPRFGGERNSQDNQNKHQFEAINAKLDKILNLLQSRSNVGLDSKIEAKPLKSKEATKKKTPKEKE